MNPSPPLGPRPPRSAPIVWALCAGAAAVAIAFAHPRRGWEGFLAVGTSAVGVSREDRQRKPNRLIREKSPYLLQHATNPVDWYPWAEEAFAKARRENKPIFLSIGYSTCHWCHVMERESFEDDSVAALLNQWFVAIKVDREERPDVDRIYMSAMQALGLGGGWPLNAFLTPELEPFFGGTYFPPRASFGRPGLMELLPRVHQAWTEQSSDLASSGARVLDALAGLDRVESAGAVEVDSLAERTALALAQAWDREQGGFGREPKFPSVANLNFLWRLHGREPAGVDARALVTRQLDAMQAGGIHDHLGGGFHRYSTDRAWLVPHFEKMLYDQAQLAWAYLEAAQNTGDESYRWTARGIFDYVARDLTSKEGAFDSAEDADSEGEEGKFYVWTKAEIDQVLGGEDAGLFCRVYGVTDSGNFEGGTNVLHRPPVREGARDETLDADVERRLAAARARLLEVRSRRPRPHRDDKVITAWNGLMISAFARGARVLGDPALAERARKAAEFVWGHLRDPRSGALHRRWREGEAAGAGQLDDYADLALGFLDLYQATFEPRWLERAVQVTEQMVGRFWDDQNGGFFESPAGDPSVKLRLKDAFDGAELAGGSVAMWVLQQLGVLLDRTDWLAKVDRSTHFYGARLAPNPGAMPQMLVAMDLARSQPRHVVVAGEPGARDTELMLAEARRRFLPNDLLLFVDGDRRQKELARLLPFVEPLRPRGGKATAYVCVDRACRLPTQDPAAFAASLERSEPPLARSRKDSR